MTSDLLRLSWYKSSYSQPTGECVEVAHLPTGAVGIRDSKNSTGPALLFTALEWDAFLRSARQGEFRHP